MKVNPISKLFNVKGWNVVVTGSAGTLGSQYSTILSQAGANVILIDINNENKQFAQKLKKLYKTKAKSYSADISDAKQVQLLKKNILCDFDQIDGLINNAAYTNVSAIKSSEKSYLGFEHFPTELWKKSLAVNLDGVFYCCKEFGSVMAKQKKGSIVNISSTYGLSGVDQRIYGNNKINSPISYTAAKGAIISMTRYLAAYWHKKNVRVNTLSPGGVMDTKYQKKSFIKKYSDKTILGRMAHKDEYNGAILFLLSDASSYMTGSNLVVDGGWTAW